MRVLKSISLEVISRVVYLFTMSIIIWFGSPYIKIGTRLPFNGIKPRIFLIIAVIAMILLRYGVLALFDYYTNKKLRNKLLKSYNLKQDVSKKELKIYHTQLQNLFHVLRSLKLKNYQGKSIKTLPWLILLGASKSGKTGLLKNSGLDFPLEELKEEAGTKDSVLFTDWHLTGDALILKFPSPVEDSETQEKNLNVLLSWYSFIEYLKTYKRTQTITGIIITFAADDLLTHEPEYIKKITAGVISQLKQVMQQVEGFCPIHLVITKADLIEGYEEFYKHLELAQNDNILGVSLPLQEKTTVEELQKQFKTNYNTFITELNQQLLPSLNKEPILDNRQKILNFTSILFSLKERLSQLITTVFESTTFHGTNSITGLYFCSSVQEPSSSLNYGFCQENLPPKNTGPAFALFKSIVLPCSRLVTNKPYYSIAYKILRTLVLIILFCLILFICTGISAHYLLNKQRTEQITLELKLIENHLQQNKVAENSIENTLPILNILEQNQLKYKAQLKFWRYGFKLYEYYFKPAVTDFMLEYALQNIFLPEVSNKLKTKLLSLSHDDQQLYGTMFAYLYLGEPNFNKDFGKMQLKKVMDELWQTEYYEELEIKAELNKYLELALINKFSGVSIDLNLVDNYRKNIAQQPSSIRIYKELQQGLLSSGIEGTQYKLTLLDPAITKVFKIEKNYSFPELYTANGFEVVFKGHKPLIHEYIQNDFWLMNASPILRAQEAKISQEIMQLYSNDFIHHWNEVLADLKIKHHNNLPSLVETLEIIIENPNYFYASLNILKENTNIDLINSNKEFKEIFAKYTNVLVPTPEKVVPLEHMILQLKNLHEYLYMLANAPNSGEACFKIAQTRFSDNLKDDPIKQILSQANNMPTPINSWFIDLAENSWQIIMQEAITYVNKTWKDSVYDDYETIIAGFYPLEKNSSFDIATEDFANFFGPTGKVQLFFDKYLAPFVDATGERWEALTLDGQQFKLLDDTLRSFRVAKEIQRLYFTSGTKQLQVRGKIRTWSLDDNAQSVMLTINKQMLSYRHGPLETKQFIWPASVNNSLANISFVDFNGEQASITFTGEWAMFKLLENFSFRNTNKTIEQLIVDCTLNKMHASFTLMDVRNSDLFTFKQLRKFKVEEIL